MKLPVQLQLRLVLPIPATLVHAKPFPDMGCVSTPPRHMQEGLYLCPGVPTGVTIAASVGAEAMMASMCCVLVGPPLRSVRRSRA